MVSIEAVRTVADEVASAQVRRRRDTERDPAGDTVRHTARDPVRPVNPTRQRVLAAALALFNERGTSHVTTNHIAAAAGLSPGNLYYWFRNKQQVIRALVEQWIEKVDAHVAEAHDQPADVHALWDDLFRTADLECRYRFIRREAAALLYDDPELARLYREAYRRRLTAQEAYLGRLVRVGVLEPPAPPRTLEDLAVALWMVAEYWPTHAGFLSEDVARLRREGRQTGVRPLLAVLVPHLTEAGVRALESP